MAIELQIQEENRLTLEAEADGALLLSGNEAYRTFVDDYDQLTNKPQINGVILEGNKTLEELGYTVDDELSDESTNPVENQVVTQALNAKINNDDTLFILNEQPIAKYPTAEFYAAEQAGQEDDIAVFSDGEVIWEDPTAITVGKAIADENGNNINSTYSKDAYFILSKSNSTFTLTLNEVLNSTTAINFSSASKNPVKLQLTGTNNGSALITQHYQAGVGNILTVMFADAITHNNEYIAGVSFTYSYVRPGAFIATFYGYVYPWDASRLNTIEQNIDELSQNVEYTSNKVTSISSASTNTQYPSAKAVYDALPTKTSDLANDGSDNTSTYVEADELATVATSGSYNDLTNKPTIPAAQVNSDWNANSGVAQILNKPTIPTKTSELTNNGSDNTSTYVEADELATVATSGSYADLLNIPTIHEVPSGGNSGQVLKKNSSTDYDVHWANETIIYPSGYCTTAGGTNPKVVNCSLWTATPNTYLQIILGGANTYADAITMRINGSSAIPVYINDNPSSSTNYSLPAGSYISFYDGTNIYLRTDGKLPGNIAGEAAATEAKLGTKADSVGATANYAAKLTASIPFGKCNSTSTSTAFTATVPGITELKDGTTMLLYNGVVTSASGFTINVNGLGAKPSYNNMTMGNPVTPTTPTRDTTIFNINYAFLFVYSETLVSGGCWIGYRGYDANTNTIGYQLRTNSSTMKASAKFYRYRLLFTSADGTKWVPANTSTSTNATALREVIQTPIDPFGEIVWYGTTTAIEANATVTAAQLWQEYAGSYSAIGYSFNRTGAAQTMTTNAPIYIKCTPQADGSAIIDATTPYTQALPTTEDGKIYIYLGRAYSATNFEITMNHPVYYYHNGGIRLWTGEQIIPSAPSADGTYRLTCVVNNGAVTYSWTT